MPTQLRADQPDPEAQALLRTLNLAQRRLSQRTPTLARMRRQWTLMSTLMARRLPLPAVENHRIAGPGGRLALRLFRPEGARGGAPRPLFVWLHGGGFVLGGLATADAICRAIAQRSGAIVATVHYRLAPEHDLYAGRDDALAALDWLQAQAAELGIDPERFAVGGDSAGGNIAAALTRDLQARPSTTAPRLQVLVYPATNLRDAYGSRTENAEGYLLTADSIAWFDGLIGTRHTQVDDPRLSPALAAEVAGLPPALVLSAGFDPIRDDGLAYAQRLREVGVPVQLLHYAGQFHGFLNFDAVLRAARDALDRIGDALAEAFVPDATQATMPDRTLELQAELQPGATPNAWARQAWAGGWMLAEWVEQTRNSLAHAWVPRTPLTPLFAQPWMNPATALRSQLVASFAPLRAHETYRG